MKRTKHNQNQLAIFSELSNRMALLDKMTPSAYEGDRDLYRALGYIQELKYSDYYVKWKRFAMGRAIINKPVDAAWKKGVVLSEAGSNVETDLEIAWKELVADDQMALIERLKRFDKLTGLGRFGVLLLGLNDVSNSTQLATPVTGDDLELVYVKPFGEGSVTIDKYETNPSNPRYGRPVLYKIRMDAIEQGCTADLVVHYSRVIHCCSDELESEIYGSPRLEPVFNNLQDLEKIIGGSGEMFWRGARPGYQGKLKENYTMTQAARKELEGQLDEYEHNLRRFLVNEGIDIDALQSQVADPLSHVDAQVQMISAATGIPKRILVGSERGELASTQDKSAWLQLIQNRRTEFIEPKILIPFVTTCQQYGILPQSKDVVFTFQWEDLFATSDKEKADVGRVRAEALARYTANLLTQETLPPEAFFKMFLGLSTEQIDEIIQIKDNYINGEEHDMELDRLREALDITPPAQGVKNGKANDEEYD
jgi:hypothetical protein